MAKHNKPLARRRAAPGPPRKAPEPKGGPLWLYGNHAVLAALANPRRRCRRLLIAEETRARLDPAIEAALTAGGHRDLDVESLPRQAIGELLPDGAVHQGLALLAEPLPDHPQAGLAAACLEACSARRPAPPRDLVIALDQVTDPQNVGAVLRAAAVFGAGAVLAPRRHAPAESGALAKVASGALERVPYLRVANLARALDELKGEGFWSLGLSAEAEQLLPGLDPGPRVVLVLGAEGPGLRRLTRTRCDFMARLPGDPAFATLNVAGAATVALYELLGRPSGATQTDGSHPFG